MTAAGVATSTRTPLAVPVALLPGVDAWFTTRAAGNLAHRRPHLPSELGRSRSALRAELDLPALHLMRQVHGATVGVVDHATTPGAELRGVDALVTALAQRALAVQVADCVPVLIASTRGPVAAVHAGRRGLQAGVVSAALAALDQLGAPTSTLRAVLGPAIRGCCYEVPEDLCHAVAAAHPSAAARTTWGTPSLDLARAVAAGLETAGVAVVDDGTRLGCTRCDPAGRWFSHRADPAAGRQLGIVMRRAADAEVRSA